MSPLRSLVRASNDPSSPPTVTTSGNVSAAESEMPSTGMSSDSANPEGQRYSASYSNTWLGRWTRQERLERFVRLQQQLWRFEQLFWRGERCDYCNSYECSLSRDYYGYYPGDFTRSCVSYRDFYTWTKPLSGISYIRPKDYQEILPEEQPVTLPTGHLVSDAEQPHLGTNSRLMWELLPWHTATAMTTLYDWHPSISAVQ